jgi:hypothetical protein
MSHLVNVQNNENGQVKSITMNHSTFPLFTANKCSTAVKAWNEKPVET